MRNKTFAYSILGLNVAAAWASWWVLAGAILGEMRHVWLYPILALSLWGIVFTLSAIAIKSRKLIYSSFAAGVVGYPLFFGPSLSIVGALLALALFVFTERQAKKEIARGIKIDFYHVVSHTLKYFVTAVCLAIAVAYYFSITERPKPASATVIETKTLEAEIDWGLKAAGLVLSDDKKEMIEDITNNTTVDDFLSKNFIQPEIADSANTADNATEVTRMIGNATAVEVQQQLLAKSKRDLSKQLGVDVVGEQPMKNVLMAYIDKTERSFFDYSGTDKFYVPIVLAIGLFLTARILGTVVDLALGLIILGVIKLLRTAGVIGLRSEQKEVSMIEYSI